MEVKDYKKFNSTASSQQNTRNKKREPSQNNKSNKTSLYMIGYALIIGIIVIFGILYINKYVEMNKMNLEISQIQKEIHVLEDKKQELQLRISQHKSLDRIEKIAKTDLGMVKPKKINYVSMNKKGNDFAKNNNSSNIKSENIKFSKLGHKISSWFKVFGQVEAGTLDK